MSVWSAWKSVARDGTIPASLLPASSFRLKWFCMWEVYVEGGGINTQQVKGDWRWQIYKDSTTYFDEKVHVSGRATTLELGGGLSLFTWYPEDASERIYTLTPEKPPLWNNERAVWFYDDTTNYGGPGWRSVSQFGTVIDKSDPGIADGYATIYFDWYGVGYNIPIPLGSKVKVPFHNTGATWLRYSLSNIQISTIAGSFELDSEVDDVGIYRVVQPDTVSLRQHYSFDAGLNWNSRRMPQRLYDPCVVKDHHNTLFVSGKLAEYGWVMWHSMDDGLTWEEDRPTMWDASYDDVKVAVNKNGEIITIAKKGGYIWCRYSNDDFAQTVRIGAATNSFDLTTDRFTQRLIATDGKSTTYTSVDGGRTWTLITGSID